MHKNIKFYHCVIVALLLTAGVFGCPATSVGQTSFVNKVIASIEGDPITYEDLRAYLKIIGKGDVNVYALPQPELVKVTQELLSSRLIEKEAETLHLTVTNEEIAEYVQEVLVLNKLTQKQFTDALASRGLTMSMYKEQVRRDIYRNKIIMMVIRNSVGVSDEDIDRYLKEQTLSTPQKGQVGVEQLYYGFSFGEKAGTRKKLEMVLQQAKERPDLAHVDEEHYRDLGFVSPQDLKPELRDALDKLQSGEISDLIETDEGIYILRVTMKADDPKKDPTVRAKIRDIIFNEKYPQRVEKYFSEDLPKKYFIEVKV